jgi:hypothetical protein
VGSGVLSGGPLGFGPSLNLVYEITSRFNNRAGVGF